MGHARRARDEDHAHRAEGGHRLVVVAGAARREAFGEAEASGGVADDLAHARIARRGDVAMQLGEGELRLIEVTDAFRLALNAREHRVDLVVVEIAELERADDLARDHVGRAGESLDAPDRPDLTSGDAADDAIHHLDESCRGESRVVSIGHRRGAGVVLEAGHGHFPLLDADDSLDDADILEALVENAALLYVESEVAGDVALVAFPAIQLRRIAADERDALLHRLAAVRDSLQFG